jgi:hypothetical protein
LWLPAALRQISRTRKSSLRHCVYTMKLMPLNALLTKYCWSAGLSAESMGSSDRPSA